VTGIFLALFWLSCLELPGELTDGISHMDAIYYSPIFKAPAGGTWQKRRPSVNVVYTWGVLVVSYGATVLLVADTKRRTPVQGSQADAKGGAAEV
jgi:hypothetical protein